MPELDRHTRRKHIDLFTMTLAADKTITILTAAGTGSAAHTVSIICNDGTALSYVYIAASTPSDTETIATTCRRINADGGSMVIEKCILTSLVLKTNSVANVTVDIELFGDSDMSGTTVA